VSWSDYPWKRFFDQLTVGQIHLIWGNHDKEQFLKGHSKVVKADKLRNIQVNNHAVVLCHYALRSWLGRGHGAFHLYGHSHGKLPGDGRSMDVGVDTNDFYPWSWEDIEKKLGSIEYKPDHRS